MKPKDTARRVEVQWCRLMGGVKPIKVAGPQRDRYSTGNKHLLPVVLYKGESVMGALALHAIPLCKGRKSYSTVSGSQYQL